MYKVDSELLSDRDEQRREYIQRRSRIEEAACNEQNNVYDKQEYNRVAACNIYEQIGDRNIEPCTGQDVSKQRCCRGMNITVDVVTAVSMSILTKFFHLIVR